MKNFYDNYDYYLYYALIGDRSVGKTQLIYRYEKDKYDDSILSTTGYYKTLKTLMIEDKIILLTIYDSGKDVLLRLNTIQNFTCVIFVYDITDKESFENVPKYLKNFQKNNNNKLVFKVLVGNKSDEDGNKERQVEKKEGIKFAEDHHMLFFETSAKYNKNVKEIFKRSAHEILDKINKGEYNLNNLSYGIKKDKKKCETCCSCYIF